MYCSVCLILSIIFGLDFVIRIREDGIDEGGVQKEFFQIIFRSLFDLDYGMFTYDSVSRLHWFNKSSIENPNEFKLLGIIVAIALYNNVILDLHFPMVVYRKLKGLVNRI